MDSPSTAHRARIIQLCALLIEAETCGDSAALLLSDDSNDEQKMQFGVEQLGNCKVTRLDKSRDIANSGLEMLKWTQYGLSSSVCISVHICSSLL